MTYDAYRIVFYSGVGLSIFFFILAVVLFFVLRIPAVIGDLTGKTAQRAIENIRSKNEKGGEMAYKKNENLFVGNGKKDPKSDSSGNGKGNTNGLGWLMSTTKFNTQILANEAKESYETTVLAQPGNETTVLDAANGTTVLSNGDMSGTTVLEQEMAPAQIFQEVEFSIEYEITFIHTDEVIE